jgi:hypothetical protein
MAQRAWIFRAEKVRVQTGIDTLGVDTIFRYKEKNLHVVSVQVWK